jgi:glycosyltransferase involved in cell wall biosynthesis
MMPQSVTVIMPIRNESAFIARSLGAVLAQEYPSELMEILVADGMSDDDTRQIIAAMPGAERVCVFDNPRRIQSAGLNEAIRQAKGDIIVRVDGHTIIAPDYVRQCVDALRATGADNVGGAMDPVGLTDTGKAIAAAGKSPFAVPTAFHVSATPQFTDTVYMGAWPRAVFEKVGFFREDFIANEDYEHNVRIRAAGGKIFFSPQIRSVYYGRQTLLALAHQYYRYGKSKVGTLREHPSSIRPRQLVAPLFVAGLIAGVPLSWLSSLLRALWWAGLLAYGVANLLFSWKAAVRLEPQIAWRVPLAFFTVHLAWGIGFWVELLKIDRIRTAVMSD